MKRIRRHRGAMPPMFSVTCVSFCYCGWFLLTLRITTVPAVESFQSPATSARGTWCRGGGGGSNVYERVLTTSSPSLSDGGGGGVAFARRPSWSSSSSVVVSHGRGIVTRRQQVFDPTSLYLAGLFGQNDVDGLSSSSSSFSSPNDAGSGTTTTTVATTGGGGGGGSGRGGDENSNMPSTNERGMYQIETKEQHAALLAAHPDKLVVVKFIATFCKACQMLAPKFSAVMNDKQLDGLPIVWAEFKSTRSNKDFFRSLGVLSLPTVHFYDGSNGLVENFPCSPSKISILKKKLASFLNARVDPGTLRLREVTESPSSRLADIPRQDRAVSSVEAYGIITDEKLRHLRSLWFFADLTDAEFDDMLKKARLQSFLPGDVIVRQGELRQTFFVVKSGAVEMSIRSRFEDPISTPPNYLGAVVAELSEFDYFGERACTTGEPYAASFKVMEKTRCFAFNAEDIPESSVLSFKRKATREIVERLDERYELPEDYTPPYSETSAKRDENILELLVRFKQIRQVAKGFEYVMKTNPNWGDEGEIARRSLLVSKLSKSQVEEFKDVFGIVDVHKNNRLTLLEMRKFMESARAAKTDEELTDMINKARVYDPTSGGHADSITLNEFLGVMAEAEFYNLLTETFRALDEENTGYVRAGDLNVMLGGVRDIIGGDPKSIIDAEDQDIQIDYEQYSKMLLGAAL